MIQSPYKVSANLCTYLCTSYMLKVIYFRQGAHLNWSKMPKGRQSGERQRVNFHFHIWVYDHILHIPTFAATVLSTSKYLEYKSDLIRKKCPLSSQYWVLKAPCSKLEIIEQLYLLYVLLTAALCSKIN